MQPGASSFPLQRGAPLSTCPGSGAGIGSGAGPLRLPCGYCGPGASETQLFSHRFGGGEPGVRGGLRTAAFPPRPPWPLPYAHGVSYASREDTSPAVGSHPVASLNRNHPLKGFVSKCSHVGGQGFNLWILWGHSSAHNCRLLHGSAVQRGTEKRDPGSLTHAGVTHVPT